MGWRCRVIDLTRELDDADRLIGELKRSLDEVRRARTRGEVRFRLEAAQDAASLVSCRIDDMASNVEESDA